MAKKNKTRRLWLQIRVLKAAKGLSQKRLSAILIQSIRNGTYELPRGWDIRLLWRNKEEAPWREDSWQNALADSSVASEGFDLAVLAYLRRQRKKAA